MRTDSWPLLFGAALGVSVLSACAAEIPNVTLVDDLTPGSSGTNPKWMVECHGYLYFQSDDEEMYRYHGPTNHIAKVFSNGDDNLRIGAACYDDNLFYYSNIREYFSGARDTWSFYKFDGTKESFLYETESESINGMTPFNGASCEFQSKLYLGLPGPKLAFTDGDFVVIAWNLHDDKYPNLDHHPRWMTTHEGDLYFVTTTELSTGALWKFDGTTATLLVDFELATGDQVPVWGWLTSFQSDLYFQLGSFDNINGESRGVKLVKWDGQSLTLVETFASLNGGRMRSWIAVFNNEMYFKMYDRQDVNGYGGGAYALYKYDGTNATFVSDMDHDGRSGWLFAFEDHLYFTKSDGTLPDGETQVFRTDGTTTGTSVVAPTIPYDPMYFMTYQGRLFFSAKTDETGHELWVLTPEGWVQPTEDSEINASGGRKGTETSAASGRGAYLTTTFALIAAGPLLVAAVSTWL